MSEEDKSAVDQVKNGIVFHEDSAQYSAPIPFRYPREETAKILNARNYEDIAKKRSFNMVKRMNREPERKAGTLKSIKDFFDRIPTILDILNSLGSQIMILSNQKKVRISYH